jgi:hypothetical protein
MRRIERTLALFLVALPLVPAAAQSVSSIPVGARVRVQTPPAVGWRVGTLMRFDSANLVLRSWAGSQRMVAVEIPLLSVHALEVSRGHPGARGRGIVGFVIGGFAGGLVGSIGAVSSAEDGEPAPGTAIAGMAIGAIVGGLLGSAIGANTGRERWEPVPLRSH